MTLGGHGTLDVSTARELTTGRGRQRQVGPEPHQIVELVLDLSDLLVAEPADQVGGVLIVLGVAEGDHTEQVGQHSRLEGGLRCVRVGRQHADQPSPGGGVGPGLEAVDALEDGQPGSVERRMTLVRVALHHVQ